VSAIDRLLFARLLRRVLQLNSESVGRLTDRDEKTKVSNCPACGKAAPNDSSECPYCGVVYAKFRAPVPEPTASAPGSALPSVEPHIPYGADWEPPIRLGFLLSLLAVLVVAGGAALYWYGYGPCGVETVKRSAAELEAAAAAWGDADAIASRTARIALATPVAELQKIKRTTELLVAPKCLMKAKLALITSMEASINAYLGFMADSNDTSVQLELLTTKIQFLSFHTALDGVRECAPMCQ
jgi:hypothetical protein